MEANKRFEMVPDPEMHAKPEAIWQRRDFAKNGSKKSCHIPPGYRRMVARDSQQVGGGRYERRTTWRIQPTNEPRREAANTNDLLCGSLRGF